MGVYVPSDWGKVTAEKIINNGGRGLMLMYHDSIFDALKATYPEIHWELHQVSIRNESN